MKAKDSTWVETAGKTVIDRLDLEAAQRARARAGWIIGCGNGEIQEQLAKRVRSESSKSGLCEGATALADAISEEVARIAQVKSDGSRWWEKSGEPKRTHAHSTMSLIAQRCYEEWLGEGATEALSRIGGPPIALSAKRVRMLQTLPRMQWEQFEDAPAWLTRIVIAWASGNAIRNGRNGVIEEASRDSRLTQEDGELEGAGTAMLVHAANTWPMDNVHPPLGTWRKLAKRGERPRQGTVPWAIAHAAEHALRAHNVVAPVRTTGGVAWPDDGEEGGPWRRKVLDEMGEHASTRLLGATLWRVAANALTKGDKRTGPEELAQMKQWEKEWGEAQTQRPAPGEEHVQLVEIQRQGGKTVVREASATELLDGEHLGWRIPAQNVRSWLALKRGMRWKPRVQRAGDTESETQWVIRIPYAIDWNAKDREEADAWAAKHEVKEVKR